MSENTFRVRENESIIRYLSLKNFEISGDIPFNPDNMDEAVEQVRRRLEKVDSWSIALTNRVSMYRHYRRLLSRAVPPDLPIYAHASRWFIGIITHHDGSPDMKSRQIVIGDLIKLLEELEETKTNIYDQPNEIIGFIGNVME